MGGGETELRGPDLTEGVSLSDLKEDEPFLGHAEETPVVLVRRGDEVLAISAICSHWGGPLGEGAVVGDTVRCPWHHACFDLRTGEARGAPALNPVDRWTVEVRDGRAFVTGKEEAGDPLDARGRSADGPESVVIVGAGAAGSAAAEMLRREGYQGPVVLIDPDEPAPYDRPNLSKDYLAGNAPEEWIPLRSAEFWSEHGVERRTESVAAMDPEERTVRLDGGETISYGALLLATGSSPIRLTVAGADEDHVHVLRTLADTRAIIAAAKGAENVVVVGASFIGMEVAMSLRQRGLDVTVVAPEAVPFARAFGEEVGRYVQRLHADNGVQFRLGSTVAEIREASVVLDDKDRTALDADLVVVGIGVRPDTGLAQAAGLDVDDGILVSDRLETSVPGIYAAGDAARYPDPRTGERYRIEHWQVAQRQGQAAARNILGRDAPYADAPFFWTQHYDVPLAYVGHTEDWDEIRFDGTPGEGPFVAEYLKDGERQAVLSYFRDDVSLEFEAELEGEDGSGG